MLNLWELFFDIMWGGAVNDSFTPKDSAPLRNAFLLGSCLLLVAYGLQYSL